MPTACQAYYTVRECLSSLLCGLSKPVLTKPQLTKPQLTNLSLLTFGLFAAGNCQLPRIAVKLPRIAVKLPVLTGAASLTQRLRRLLMNKLLMNKAIQPTEVYQPVARFLLSCFLSSSVRLILDATDLGGRLPVLFVAVAYRGRALPLLWQMLPKIGCSAFPEQKALLSEVAALIPPDVTVTLLADREYGSIGMTRFCLKQGWHFCLRLKKNRWFTDADGQRRQISALSLTPGGRLFMADIRLAGLPEQTLSLCCGWSRDNKDDEPWYILSDLPADNGVLKTYNGRFHIEEMFRDFKEFGFRLETTHLRDNDAPTGQGACFASSSVRVLGARVADERRGLGEQAGSPAAGGPSQGAAVELLSDRLAFLATYVGLRTPAPVRNDRLQVKKVTVTQVLPFNNRLSYSSFFN